MVKNLNIDLKNLLKDTSKKSFELLASTNPLMYMLYKNKPNFKFKPEKNYSSSNIAPINNSNNSAQNSYINAKQCLMKSDKVSLNANICEVAQQNIKSENAYIAAKQVFLKTDNVIFSMPANFKSGPKLVTNNLSPRPEIGQEVVKSLPLLNKVKDLTNTKQLLGGMSKLNKTSEAVLAMTSKIAKPIGLIAATVGLIALSAFGLYKLADKFGFKNPFKNEYNNKEANAAAGLNENGTLAAGYASNIKNADLVRILKGETKGLKIQDQNNWNVTSGFNPNTNRTVTNATGETISNHPHVGTDFGVQEGTPIYSPINGIIQSAKLEKAGGNTIRIKGQGVYKGIEEIYMHLSIIFVKQGQKVEKGDLLALSGGVPGKEGSGSSTGAHLHESRKINGKYVNPATHKIDDMTTMQFQQSYKKGSANYQKLVKKYESQSTQKAELKKAKTNSKLDTKNIINASKQKANSELLPDIRINDDGSVAVSHNYNTASKNEIKSAQASSQLSIPKKSSEKIAQAPNQIKINSIGSTSPTSASNIIFGIQDELGLVAATNYGLEIV